MIQNVSDAAQAINSQTLKEAREVNVIGIVVLLLYFYRYLRMEWWYGFSHDVYHPYHHPLQECDDDEKFIFTSSQRTETELDTNEV